MVDYGFKISKQGHDVKTASEKDLIFSSAENLLKVKFSGSTYLYSNNIREITHNLGYAPQFLAYAQQSPYPNDPMYLVLSDSDITDVIGWVDSNKLYLQNTAGTPGSTYDVYYYIMVDQM